MNLPPITEETLVLCMGMMLAIGALLGFALGYSLKEKRHAAEIKSIVRITKRISEARTRTTVKKEGAQKGPQLDTPVNRLPC